MLRIRDVARKVEIPFVHTGSFTSPSGRSQREGFEASLTLKRADYGVVHEGNILETSGAIGKEVSIEIELSAVRLHWEAFPFRARDAKPTLGERLLALVDSEGPAAAVEHYRQVLESSAEPAATSAQDMAILSARLAAGDHASTAARLLELYAGSEPESDDAQLLAADALLRIGSQEAALAYYRKASALAPERVEAVERIRALTGRANEATLIQPTR
jgi:tetratricopeptide (TPR) repeat protein